MHYAPDVFLLVSAILFLIDAIRSGSLISWGLFFLDLSFLGGHLFVS